MRATLTCGVLMALASALCLPGVAWSGEESPHHPKAVAPKDGPKPEAKEGAKDQPRERRDGERRDGERRDGERRDGDARARHLREAAAHLREAGMPELAERVLRESEREPGRKIEGVREGRRADGPEAMFQRMAQQIEQLHREVRELREQVEQIKRDHK